MNLDNSSLKFTTKEISKREAEKEFLKLSPSDRFMEFLRLCEEVGKFESHTKKEDGNFILRKKEELS